MAGSQTVFQNWKLALFSIKDHPNLTLTLILTYQFNKSNCNILVLKNIYFIRICFFFLVINESLSFPASLSLSCNEIQVALGFQFKWKVELTMHKEISSKVYRDKKYRWRGRCTEMFFKKIALKYFPNFKGAHLHQSGFF